MFDCYNITFPPFVETEELFHFNLNKFKKNHEHE